MQFFFVNNGSDRRLMCLILFRCESATFMLILSLVSEVSCVSCDGNK